MTTTDIIKILPLEEQEKLHMLNVYETGTQEQKIDIDELAWASYFEIYNARVKEHVDNEMNEIKEGKGGSLDNQIYARALKKTQQELNKETDQTLGEVNLDLARKAMQQIIQEINASKGKAVN